MYKRQTELRPKQKGKVKKIALSEYASTQRTYGSRKVPRSVQPVSYTHLDVYKRQDLVRSQSDCRAAVCGSAAGAAGLPVCGGRPIAAGPAGACLLYTSRCV